MHCELIFRGETSQGISLAQGQSAAARLFRLDPQQSAHQQKLTRLFSGKPVSIKKNLSEKQAQQLKDKLSSAGLLCYIKQHADVDDRVAESRPETAPARAGGTDFPGIEESSSSAAADKPDNATSGLSLVPQEQQPSSGEQATSDEEPAGLSLVAREQPPAEEQHDAPAAQERAVAGAGTGSDSMQQARSTGSSYTRILENTSGEGSGAHVPDEVQGWCWGGFLLGWIWAVFNRSWIGLLGLIPIVNIPVAVLLGLKGRQWAWQNRRWQDEDHFNRVQRNWSIGGLVVAVIWFLFYWSSLSAVNDMVDLQEGLSDAQIESIEDDEQREALKKFRQQIEELKRQQALQNP